MIPFGEYMPDQSTFENPGTAYVNNVVPRAKDYGPVSNLVAQSDAMTARCQGVISVRDNSGGSWAFAGTQTKLYRMGGALTWANVSQSATTYATPSTGYWEFAKFGNLVLATNSVDAIQKFNVNSSTVFADLGGSPPVAKHIAAVRDFVVLGDVSGDASLVRWSAFNNAESWTIGTSQADSQDTPTGGRIQRIIGGEIGYVFKEFAIYRMNYEGAPIIFRFDEVEPNRGLLAPGGIARVGKAIFYMSNEGFYMLDAVSGMSTPIGAEKVDRTVYGDMNQQFLDRISCAVDPVNRLVKWLYPSSQSNDGTPDSIITYNYATQRWAREDATADLICSVLSPGYTLEGLDSVDDLDSLQYSLDSNAWNSSSWVMSGFTSTFKLGYFSGSYKEATLDSAEFSMGMRRSIITNVMPIVDSSAATCAAASRERRADSSEYGTASSMRNSGNCPLLSSGRYHRIRTTIPAGEFWTVAQGLEVNMQADGEQ